MNKPYLEIICCRGRAIAAYLYLPRSPGDKSRQISKADPVIIAYAEDGKPIGIEITAPAKVTVDDLSRVLANLGAAALTSEDVAPLMAA